jgi:hypothetical protein
MRTRCWFHALTLLAITGCHAGLAEGDKAYVARVEAAVLDFNGTTVPAVVETFGQGAHDLRASQPAKLRKAASETLIKQSDSELVMLGSVRVQLQAATPSPDLATWGSTELDLVEKLTTELQVFRAFATECARPDPDQSAKFPQVLSDLNQAASQRVASVENSQKAYDRLLKSFPELGEQLGRTPTIGPFSKSPHP